MTVDELMSTRLVSVSLDDHLDIVRQIFSRTGFHHLLVVEEGLLVGVLSDRDLFRAISPNLGTPAETAKDIATLNKHVHQIMARQPITLTSGAPITDAIALMADQPISCVPIVDEKQRPLGIITWRDVMRWLKKQG
ncbi:CBS domain-containing protein [Spongiibacter sp. KMU-158]|uniref:CBS domain-containing protein n=1 Tax=Spongiibacter pelagi TaxID=2760804 RepID=A0A927C0J4_9GAMM|nr:CBS domain-containing protein [Spongiibacter pelagi]MBD2857571.1 CBS domain-containing protein [Spongiibacter pelagi]